MYFLPINVKKGIPELRKISAMRDKNIQPIKTANNTPFRLDTRITIAIGTAKMLKGWNSTESKARAKNSTMFFFWYKNLYTAKAIIQADVAVLNPELT